MAGDGKASDTTEYIKTWGMQWDILVHTLSGNRY